MQSTMKTAYHENTVSWKSYEHKIQSIMKTKYHETRLQHACAI